VVARLVAAFTAPGEDVLLAVTQPTDRITQPADSEPPHAAVQAVLAADRHVRVLHTVLTSLSHEEAHHHVDTGDHTRPGGSPGGAQRSRRSVPAASAADLLILAVDPHEPVPAGIGTICATLIRPEGILAVVTHSDSHHGRLIDVSGRITVACQQADLRYLQHIVTITAPIHDGTISPPTVTTRTRRPGHRRHARAHHDVLIFTRPATDSLPADTPSIQIGDAR
jgi:hypothetical protein